MASKGNAKSYILFDTPGCAETPVAPCGAMESKLPCIGCASNTSSCLGRTAVKGYNIFLVAIMIQCYEKTEICTDEKNEHVYVCPTQSIICLDISFTIITILNKCKHKPIAQTEERSSGLHSEPVINVFQPSKMPISFHLSHNAPIPTCPIAPEPDEALSVPLTSLMSSNSYSFPNARKCAKSELK